jgi:hypothetical protein
MKVFKTTFALLFFASIILTGCNKYKQDLTDTEAPFCEIGIIVDQKTIEKSTKEWGLTQHYVRLEGKQTNVTTSKDKVYEFYISAKDKGGLENIQIDVCPSNALVSGSLKELSKTFDPKKTGSYFISGKIGPIDQNKKVSIRATVVGNGKNGKETHETSIYGYANKGINFHSGGRPHANLCHVTTGNNKYVRITLKKENQPTSNEALYCACMNNQPSLNCPNNTPTRLCAKNTPPLNVTSTTKAKYIENDSFNGAITVVDPDGNRHTIQKGARKAYNGPVFGTWNVFYYHKGGHNGKEYIKVYY